MISPIEILAMYAGVQVLYQCLFLLLEDLRLLSKNFIVLNIIIIPILITLICVTLVNIISFIVE
jgi:hypothetical protein